MLDVRRPEEPPRFDLRVPSPRSEATLAARVERVLVGLVRRTVAVECRVDAASGPTRTQYRPASTGPTPVRKRYHDPDLGWVAGSITVPGVRAELVDRLQPGSPLRDSSAGHLRVRPAGTLQGEQEPRSRTV